MAPVAARGSGHLRIGEGQTRAFTSLLLRGVLAAPVGLVAQSTGHAEHPWTIRTRALLVGANAESDPAGLDVYSAFAMEADISRRIGRHFAAELTIDPFILGVGVGFRF